MSNIEYWKFIVVGIATAFFLLAVFPKKSVKTQGNHIMIFTAMVLVTSSVLIRNNRSNVDWVLLVFAASIGLGNFINIFRSKNKTPNKESDPT
jgi:hypothetical protein